MDRACSTNGEKRNAYRIFVGKQEGKRPVGRPRRGWVDNIKMDLRESNVGHKIILRRVAKCIDVDGRIFTKIYHTR
jgi:hypothetical protein